MNSIDDFQINDSSLEKACEEFNNSIRLTLSLINHQLSDALIKGFEAAEELGLRIAARQILVEKNPDFLSLFSYSKKSVHVEPLQEFKEIQINLNEHFERIKTKFQDVENIHTTLLQSFEKNSLEEKEKSETKVIKNNKEEESRDCSDSTLIDNNKNFDSVTITKNAYSNASLNLRTSIHPPIKCPVFSDILPDVERRKPFENIHGHLVKQLEAADSLEGFLKLMKRKPKGNKNNLQQTYTNSLYFFPTKNKRGKNYLNSKTKSNCCSILFNQEKNKRLGKENVTQKSLKCYDLLDDIKTNDLKPIESEYPRRDLIYSTQTTKRKTYLHHIMEENEKVWKMLLHPVKIKTDSKRFRNKKVKNLMTYLTAPQQKILSNIPQSLVVMPVKISYDNFPTRDIEKSPKILQTSPNLSKKKEMLKQLRSLKVRNDNIQKNINKAIDVIESKMIDLITSPKKENSHKAFSDMEVEITNVLKLMNKPIPKDKPEKDISETKFSAFLVKNPMMELLKPISNDESLRNSKRIKKSEIKVTSKCANIEEGERLLDQVDNVIKKIDSIYNKLSEDTKNQNPSPSASIIIDHDIAFIISVSEQSATCMQEALCYHQNNTYHYTKLINPLNNIACGDGDYHRKHTQTTPREPRRNINISETVQVVEIPNELNYITDDIPRHKNTLKMFYTFFFSSIFLMLNLDYTA